MAEAGLTSILVAEIERGAVVGPARDVTHDEASGARGPRPEPGGRARGCELSAVTNAAVAVVMQRGKAVGFVRI